MANLQLNNIKDESMAVINNIFTFNDPIEEDEYSRRQIIESFIKDTPIPIIQLLLLESVRIRFEESEHFEENEDSNTIGYFRPKTNEIVVSSDLRLSRIISTMHHEIGHALDNFIRSMYMFSGKERLLLLSNKNPYIDELRTTEGEVYYSNYHKSTSSEFFAESYSEYVKNTRLEKEMPKTKEFFDIIISYLNLFLNNANLSDLGEYTLNKYPVYFLSENSFIYEKECSNNPSTKDLILYDSNNGFRKLLKNQMFYSVYRNDLCDDEFIINVNQFELNSNSNSYLLKDNKLFDLGGVIISRTSFKDIPREKTSYILKTASGKIKIIYKNNEKFYTKPYVFDSYSTFTLSNTCLGFGVNRGKITVLNPDLSVSTTIQGSFLAVHTSSSLGYDYTDDIDVILVQDDDIIKIVDEKGNVIDSILNYRSLLIPYSDVLHLSTKYDSPEIVDLVCDSDELAEEMSESTEAIFIRTKDYSKLIFPEYNDVVIVPYEDMDYCLEIDYRLENFIPNTCIDAFQTEFNYKFKYSKQWVVDSGSTYFTTNCDDLYFTIGIDGEIFGIGINYHEGHQTLSQEGVKSVEIISENGELLLSNLSYNDLKFFIEQLNL